MRAPAGSRIFLYDADWALRDTQNRRGKRTGVNHGTASGNPNKYGRPFCRAIRCYGETSFQWWELEQAHGKDAALAREKHYVGLSAAERLLINDNIRGGQGGQPISRKTRAKLSAAGLTKARTAAA